MIAEPPEVLPPERELALAHTPSALRDAMAVFLWLDQRLARIVGQTNEPILGQMRLAWWREMLSKPTHDRPQGDCVLDGISRHWSGREEALSACVDGWERLLDPAPLDEAAAQEFAAGRAAPFIALSGTSDLAALQAGKRWALVDAGLHVETETERTLLFGLARAVPPAKPLPRILRGLAILDALARRSLARGGRPLMEGRLAALVATRAAILGR